MTQSSHDFLSHRVTYIGPEGGDYKVGKDYYIMIQKMSDGRYSVFKSSHHYNEPEGYLVFPDYETIKSKFNGLNDKA